jgi:hypothetical protein
MVLDFALVYPDRQGNFTIRDIGKIHGVGPDSTDGATSPSSASASASASGVGSGGGSGSGSGSGSADALQLVRDCKLQPGDYLDVAICKPRFDRERDRDDQQRRPKHVR